jgi:hypothetical protein
LIISSMNLSLLHRSVNPHLELIDELIKQCE